jgi:predicted transposase/invertase (TIGR01784 family)
MNMAKKEVDDKGVYIDPLTDFGFKRLFGDKDLLINFLNSILKLEDGIKEIKYGNTVRTGVSKDDRAIIFDLYCITETGEHINIEMQTMSHKNYKERTLYYSSRLIDAQSKKGKDWGFALCPVYVVNIVNFIVDEEYTEKSYLSYIKYMYTCIHKTYYDNLTIVYLELPRFTLKESELKTDIERWTYALKYLPTLEKMPAAMSKKIFQKLFELAQFARLTKRQQNAYNKSLHDMGIVKLTITDLQDAIAARDNTIAAKDNTIAAQAREIEELKKRFGLNGAPAKPRSAKPRARNSKKASESVNKW